jgi:hypothetical protein
MRRADRNSVSRGPLVTLPALVATLVIILVLVGDRRITWLADTGVVPLVDRGGGSLREQP